MPPTQGYAEINGTRLYYETAGSGNPIILIHGLGSDSRFWEAQFGAFAEHYLVIRYDIRGHGKSALPSGKAYAHATDLNALLEHLDISKAHLIGQSLGGEIAINFALAHPEKTISLVLADSAVDGHQWSTEWGESWMPIYSAAPLGKDSWLPLVLAHPMFVPAFRQPSVKTRLTEIFSDYSAWHFLNSDPIVKNDPPVSQRLDQIKTPTLILLGELEPPDFHAISHLLSEKMPNTQRIEFSDAGHVVPMEVPEKFNEIVLNFLANK